MFEPWVKPETSLTLPSGQLPAAPQAQAPVLKTRVMNPLGQEYDLTSRQVVALGAHAAILLGVAYHGYRRNNNSTLWGVAWALGGVLCPVVTLGVALSQGFAKES